MPFAKPFDPPAVLCSTALRRLEYEKLHRALKKSHEQEKRLIKKCRELNGEIVNNAAKVQTALKLSQEDQTTIGSLRKEIEKAWTMVDVAHEKEGGGCRTVTVPVVVLSRLCVCVCVCVCRWKIIGPLIYFVHRRQQLEGSL